MKLILVTNDISFYGASRSLRTLIAGLQKDQSIEIKLIIPKRFFGKNNLDDVSDWFLVEKNNIYEFSLPFYNNYKGNNFSISPFLYTFLYKIRFKKIFQFLSNENPDVIHLNSLTLLDLASKEFNFVLHVREILKYKKYKKYIQSKLDNISKIIFIDEATKGSFDLFKVKNSIILNNPFNMIHLSKIDYFKSLRILPIEKNSKIVISLIGKIHPEKGSDFIVDVFNNLQRDDIILVIMGSGEVNYCKSLKNKSNSNIYFLRESADVDPLYKISDYIIRGESYPCIGRTTFEGLYSGLSVILPGTNEYYEKNIPDYINYSDKIFLYKPREVDGLLKIIENIKPIKIENRIYKSNVDDYVGKFKNYLSYE